MEVKWADLKNFVDERNLSIQYIIIGNKYCLLAFDGPFSLKSTIFINDPANDEQLEFEQNYKNNANKSPSTQVITQFEKRDKTLKLASASGTIGEDGTVAVYLQVPGTINPTGDITLDGRWISSGTAFFDVATPGDMVTSVRFVDHDNILGQGIDFVIGSYTDDDAISANQGWYIPPVKGQMTAEAIGGYGFAPAGFYIMITAKKGMGIITGTFYLNIEWGKYDD